MKFDFEFVQFTKEYFSCKGPDQKLEPLDKDIAKCLKH